ncbi:hypothetical protein SDSE159_12000 [Streptococcus dysgalactiae subsp. equisimilis]|uniref:Uncharacterized protein n=1 Tax=Streptococcus dysgalactiae TaxID=1334 RepID=A0ABU0A9B8_STRDY|nr:hypothetical protein SDE12394_06630 [Streptococcus dysgalactiae subsp. equisimilis ATCC 12394]MDQ0263873.1 hypothetical protein [Streptococcus dysgalactiae]OBZ04632.1 hypothetical protein BBG05_03350 [Streptococcus dysgalactiae subsp. equisimilis]PXX82431.1 hypothetical protein DI495_08820 [Streptococcus dysgalactiae subsp. equisimilis]SQB66661.1 Uncharacterised protein [Streptococcus dysgalactiae]
MMSFAETSQYAGQLLLLLNLIWGFILYRDPNVDRDRAFIVLFLSVITFILYQFGLVIPLIRFLSNGKTI